MMALAVRCLHPLDGSSEHRDTHVLSFDVRYQREGVHFRVDNFACVRVAYAQQYLDDAYGTTMPQPIPIADMLRATYPSTDRETFTVLLIILHSRRGRVTRLVPLTWTAAVRAAALEPGSRQMIPPVGDLLAAIARSSGDA